MTTKENTDGIRFALALELVNDERSQVTEDLMNSVPLSAVEAAIDRINSYRGPIDMPADREDLRRLIDACSFLHGLEYRANGWDVVGVLPKQGRGYLSQKANAGPMTFIGWSLFFTARQYGLGLNHHKDEALYED